MSENVTINVSGPVFDGRAEASLLKMANDCQKEIARAAEDTWQSYMDASFRHPTGRYQSHVNTARREKDLVVSDGWPESRLPYGPWLEGTGSRNSPVTKFAGYHALKRAAETVRRDTDAICQPIVDRYVHEANS
jgi:hypothetical protein